MPLQLYKMKLSAKFEEKFASNFGRSHKVEESGQLNLLETVEDSIEAPDPDDFDNLEQYEKAWKQWQQQANDEATGLED